MHSLKNKVILITGSGDVTGIGASTAKYFVQFQPKLVLTGRDSERLEKVGQMIQDEGLAQDRINNAAVMSAYSILDTTMEDFDHVMQSNLRSPIPTVASYSISKAAFDHFTKVLALEVAKDGVRVNSVNPGATKTNILVKGNLISKELLEETFLSECQVHPLQRIASPEDFAKAIAFLASTYASFTTGEILSIDGGSGDVTGIGASTAKYLVQCHPKLVLTGRDTDRLEKVGQMIQDKGLAQERILLVTADLNKDDESSHIVERTIQTFKQLDVLINNAAVMSADSILDTTMDEFDHVMQTNLRSPVNLTRNVVNISSISSLKPIPHVASYSISKAAFDHFTKVLALEVAKDGVRVNSVNPGATKTNILVKGNLISKELLEETFKNECQVHPLKRIASTEDIAKAIAFLASTDASFITGEILSVDGGRQHCVNI